MIRESADGALSLGTTAQILVRPALVDHAVELRYDPADPYAVTLRFSSGEVDDSAARGIVWRLDREALTRGHGRGDMPGDVRVTRVDLLGIVVVELAPGRADAAIIRLRSAAVDGFLDATYRAVPAGAESLDVDELVRQILERA